ncbi:hypothetical protein PR048_001453 [Dryococelus australis]|uniref:Uncharacterized protein n=1 Tax=Dryococelus australis TaxID=614101 RepID=A0ABQ9IHI1_9NEOP|nr:hypothetical protein PR048_001453 [Dryococelus australis]
MAIAIGCCLLEKVFSYLTGPLGIRQHRHGSYVIRMQAVNMCQKVIQPIKIGDCLANDIKRFKVTYSHEEALRCRWEIALTLFARILFPQNCKRDHSSRAEVPPLSKSHVFGSDCYLHSRCLFRTDAAECADSCLRAGDPFIVSSNTPCFNNYHRKCVVNPDDIIRCSSAEFGNFVECNPVYICMEQPLTAFYESGLSEVSMDQCRNAWAGGKREIPEKTRRPVASSGTIPACWNAENRTRTSLYVSVRGGAARVFAGAESEEGRSGRVKRSPCDSALPEAACKADCFQNGKGLNVGRCILGLCVCCARFDVVPFSNNASRNINIEKLTAVSAQVQAATNISERRAHSLIGCAQLWDRAFCLIACSMLRNVPYSLGYRLARELRENPPISGIVRYDSYLRKSRSDPTVNRTLPAPFWRYANINSTLVICCHSGRQQLDTVLQEVSNTTRALESIPKLDGVDEGLSVSLHEARWAYHTISRLVGHFDVRAAKTVTMIAVLCNNPRDTMTSALAIRTPFPDTLLHTVSHGTMSKRLASAGLVAHGSVSQARWCSVGIKGREKREIPEKTRKPAASFCTIPTCENPEMTRSGIEPGSPCWEASRLTTQPPWPRYAEIIPGITAGGETEHDFRLPVRDPDGKTIHPMYVLKCYRRKTTYVRLRRVYGIPASSRDTLVANKVLNLKGYNDGTTFFRTESAHVFRSEGVPTSYSHETSNVLKVPTTLSV